MMNRQTSLCAAATLALLATSLSSCGLGTAAAVSAADTESTETLPRVVAVSPEDQSGDIGRMPTLRVSLSDPIREFDTSSIRVALVSEEGEQEVDIVETSQELQIISRAELELDTIYDVSVQCTAVASTGTRFSISESWSFTVRDGQWGEQRPIPIATVPPAIALTENGSGLSFTVAAVSPGGGPELVPLVAANGEGWRALEPLGSVDGRSVRVIRGGPASPNLAALLWETPAPVGGIVGPSTIRLAIFDDRTGAVERAPGAVEGALAAAVAGKSFFDLRFNLDGGLTVMGRGSGGTSMIFESVTLQDPVAPVPLIGADDLLFSRLHELRSGELVLFRQGGGGAGGGSAGVALAVRGSAGQWSQARSWDAPPGATLGFTGDVAGASGDNIVVAVRFFPSTGPDGVAVIPFDGSTFLPPTLIEVDDISQGKTQRIFVEPLVDEQAMVAWLAYDSAADSAYFDSRTIDSVTGAVLNAQSFGAPVPGQDRHLAFSFTPTSNAEFAHVIWVELTVDSVNGNSSELRHARFQPDGTWTVEPPTGFGVFGCPLVAVSLQRPGTPELIVAWGESFACTPGQFFEGPFDGLPAFSARFR